MFWYLYVNLSHAIFGKYNHTSNSEQVAQFEGKQGLLKIKSISTTAVDLNKCLKQIKLPVLIYRFAPIFELSKISTMVYTEVI